MKYVIAILALFMAGWFAHSAYTSKEFSRALQKADQKYQTLKAYHDDERKTLEGQRAVDSAKAESRFRKVIAENDRLRAEAYALVSPEFLTYARLCEHEAECSLLYGFQPFPGATPSAGSPPTVTAQEIYQLVRVLDDNAVAANFRLAQLAEQSKACR